MWVFVTLAFVKVTSLFTKSSVKMWVTPALLKNFEFKQRTEAMPSSGKDFHVQAAHNATQIPNMHAAYELRSSSQQH